MTHPRVLAEEAERERLQADLERAQAEPKPKPFGLALADLLRQAVKEGAAHGKD